MGNIGRTSKLIRQIPESGAAIVVPTAGVGQAVADMILEILGPDMDRRCKTLVIETEEDLGKLRGVGAPIAFDHTFREMAPRALVEKAFAMVKPRNSGA